VGELRLDAVDQPAPAQRRRHGVRAGQSGRDGERKHGQGGVARGQDEHLERAHEPLPLNGSARTEEHIGPHAHQPRADRGVDQAVRMGGRSHPVRLR
jgi:hypothetical protein